MARGDTLTEIAQKLQESGVVLSADVFVNAASVDDRAATIGPGKYTLRQQMSSGAALELMLDPLSRADSRLVLQEGLRLEQTVSVAVRGDVAAEVGLPEGPAGPGPAGPADRGRRTGPRASCSRPATT